MYYSGDFGCFSTENLEPIGKKKAIEYQLYDAKKRNNKEDIEKYTKLLTDYLN
jgi:hypothetical protein